MKKEDTKILITVILLAIVALIFRGMIINLLPFILPVAWLIWSVYMVLQDKKNGEVKKLHKVSLIASGIVVAVLLLAVIFFFFIMPNPFTR